MDESGQNLAVAEKTSAYYDQLWPRLGTNLDRTELNRVRFIVESTQKFVGDQNLKILDFGCGRGWMSPFLSPLGSVTAIDFSSDGIQFARQNYGEHGQFILADTHSPTLGLPADARFDVVVCSEVIEHVPDHLSLLRQIGGFLRPRGWCMLTTPNGNVWPQFHCDSRFQNQLQPVENWLTTDRLAALVRHAGFHIARHEGGPAFGFRVGLPGILQRRRIAALFAGLGLRRLYGQLILPSALYQFVAAQKTM